MASKRDPGGWTGVCCQEKMGRAGAAACAESQRQDPLLTRAMLGGMGSQGCLHMICGAAGVQGGEAERLKTGVVVVDGRHCATRD